MTVAQPATDDHLDYHISRCLRKFALTYRIFKSRTSLRSLLAEMDWHATRKRRGSPEIHGIRSRRGQAKSR